MSFQPRMTITERAGWGLAVVAVAALGAVWHFDRTRVWERPRWDDSGLVELRAPEQAGAPSLRSNGLTTTRGARAATEAEAVRRAEPAGEPATVETWAVAVNPGCALCRGSLARAHAVRGITRAPVRLAVLVVDTKHRPSSAALASLAADELRWDSAGAWRGRWGHRVYGELLCFDPSGRFVRTLAPLGDSLATRRALQHGLSLRRVEGS